MLKSVFLVSAISSDCFAAAVSMGCAGIKIPLSSAAVIGLTGSVCFVLPVAFSEAISGFVPSWICTAVSFSLLTILGLINIFGGYFKKEKDTTPLGLLLDGCSADADNSKSLSVREAFALSAALSADSVFTGIGAGLAQANVIPLAILTFLTGFGSVVIGSALGRRIVMTKKPNIQWLCGITLIILAFLGLFRQG